MIAKFTGICPLCGNTWKKGDPIKMSPLLLKMAHARCVAEQYELAKQPRRKACRKPTNNHTFA